MSLIACSQSAFYGIVVKVLASSLPTSKVVEIKSQIICIKCFPDKVTNFVDVANNTSPVPPELSPQSLKKSPTGYDTKMYPMVR